VSRGSIYTLGQEGLQGNAKASVKGGGGGGGGGEGGSEAGGGGGG